MEISKGLQEEILAVQNKLKNAIRDHQICVGKLKDDPNNTDILAQIQKIHMHIVSLGRCQKQVIQRLRKEVEAFKTENANGAKVSIATLLGLNNNNHITNNNEAKLKSSTNDCDKTKQSKENYEEHIVRNGDVPSPTQRPAPPKERPRSVETISGEDDVIEVSMDENSNEKVEVQEKERKEEINEKLNFLCALGLITTTRCAELQNKRAERKRRSTANPQFVYASLEVPTKRKRHSYLQSSGNAPQTRQTTARMNGPSPPPPAKPAPPKSTSPPSRSVMKSLIPVQKSTTRPNILRNVTESKVYVNKTKLENGPSQAQLPMPTLKNVQSVGSKTVHIPGLPSSLTIERIENDSAICISCRNPGTLTICENCSSKYHVSCHSRSPAPPRICPKCAQLEEDDGDEVEEVDPEAEEKRCKSIKKDMELATTSQAPGIIRKAREDTEVYKTAGGLHKADATQNSRGLTSALGINQLPSSTFLIPISSNNVGGTTLNQSDGKSSVSNTAGNQDQRGNPISYPPIVINQLSQPSITYIQAEPQVSYSYQLSTSSAQTEKHQSYLIVQQLADSIRRTSSSGEEQSHNNVHNAKRSTTSNRNFPIQPKVSGAADTPVLLSKQLPDSIHRNRKKPTNRAVPALNRIFNTENLSITGEYQLERTPVNGRKSRAKPARTKLCISQLRSTRATDILLPSFDGSKSDSQLQITKSIDTEEAGLLGNHAKYKPRTSGLFHSLFTSHNKSYIITDGSRESRDIDGAGKEHPVLQQQLYHQDYQLEPSQPSEPPTTQLQRGALTKFFEHVKLEEAHLPAPPRAKLVYKGSLTPEGGEDLGASENEHIGGYGIDTKSSAETSPEGSTHAKQISNRLLNASHTNENDSTKSTESLDSSNGSTASISDCITYEHKHGNTYVTIESEAQKTNEGTIVPELTVLRCAEPYDEITPEKWRDRPSTVSRYNAQNKLSELRNEVSVPDDKADTERQDLLSGRCSSNSSASQSDTPEQAMHESIEHLGIGTVSPESMQVLEQFESAMLEADHSNAATC